MYKTGGLNNPLKEHWETKSNMIFWIFWPTNMKAPFPDNCFLGFKKGKHNTGSWCQKIKMPIQPGYLFEYLRKRPYLIFAFICL